MSATAQVTRPIAPIDLLKSAVRSARGRGIRVRIGAFGVVRTPSCPEHWQLDALALRPGVDPIGAVLIDQQPDGLDAKEAAAAALGVPPAWVEGIWDGMNLQPKASRWIMSRASATYQHGYESGVLLRLHVAASEARS